MEISGNRIVVRGNVKSAEDYEEIKNAVDSIVANNGYVVIDLIDSISLTSAVIMYLSELVEKNQIVIEMYVGDNELYDLLNDLGVINLFKVKKR